MSNSIVRFLAVAAGGGGAVLAVVAVVACHPKEKENLHPWAVQRPANVQQASLEMRLVVDQPGTETVTLPGTDGQPLHLGPPLLVRADISQVEVQRDLTQVYTQQQEAQEKAEQKDEPPSLMKGRGKPPDAARPQDDTPRYVLLIGFNPVAGGRLHDATEQNYGRQVAMVVDGRVMMTPVIHGALRADQPLMLEGHFTRDAAVRLAERLAP